MKIEIVPVEDEHVLHVAEHMRPADVRELELCQATPFTGLLESVERSDADLARCALYDGEPVAVWGASPFVGMMGGVWLLATPRFPSAPLSIMKHTRRELRRMNERYPLLTNFVHAENAQTLQWLTRLGFGIVDVIRDWRGTGETFYQIMRKADVS